MTLIKSISGIRGTIGGPAGDTLNPLDIVKFTSAYSKSSFSAMLNTSLPLAAVRNSPFSLRSLRAFHWRGL